MLNLLLQRSVKLALPGLSIVKTRQGLSKKDLRKRGKRDSENNSMGR